MTRNARALAVLAVSAGTLAYEVLLVRVFAIEQFHHFATMVLGVAMLGIGAAGTLFFLAQARGEPDRWFTPSALLAATALALAPLAAELIRVDPTALAWDARQWARLALLYLVLATPFGLGAFATLAALAQAPDRPGIMYGASLVGAGLGVATAVGSLWVLEPTRAVAIPGFLAAVGALFAARGARHARSPALAAIVVAIAAAGFAFRPPWRLHLLPYKGLPQVLAYPGARVVAERTSPLGWVLAVEAPAFRHVPGLSLAYRGAFPAQTAIFSDGELWGTVCRWTQESARILEWQPSAAPYALGAPRRVLVLGMGAREAAVAVRHGATEVTVLELQPAMIELASDPAARLTDTALVHWVRSGPRAFAARTRQRFDLVALTLQGGGGPGAGTRSLAEDYDQTVEAYVRYLALLDEGGVLAITGWLDEPPRSTARVVLTAVAALRRMAPQSVPRGLIVVRSWGTATTLVKPGGFTDREIAALAAWALERWFDLDWLPGGVAPESRFNLVERRTLFEAAQAAVGGADSAMAFQAAYPFDIRPATDARPYPHHFIGFRSIRWLLSRPRGDWLAFADWGHLALLATLAQGGVLAGVLLVIPAAMRTGGRPGGPSARLLGYFAAIGMGYLAAEIAAMQQFTLLLGHPVYAVAAVLAGLLVLSGIGSLISDRLQPASSRSLALGLALVLLAYAGVLLPLAQRLQSASLAARAMAAVVLLAPIAILMGFPFPLGVRALAGAHSGGGRGRRGGRGGRLAWAWAVNGFTSVISAPIAALVALEAGHRVVFALAAAAYAVAAVSGAHDVQPERVAG